MTDPKGEHGPFHELLRHSPDGPVWCGDIMVASQGSDPADGDLGVATTPGTGCGIVCANVSLDAIHACQALGAELAAAYHDVPLPDGSPGRLEFTSRTSSGGRTCR